MEHNYPKKSQYRKQPQPHGLSAILAAAGTFFVIGCSDDSSITVDSGGTYSDTSQDAGDDIAIPDAPGPMVVWTDAPPATATAGKPITVSWSILVPYWTGVTAVAVCPQTDPQCVSTESELDGSTGDTVTFTTALQKGNWVVRALAKSPPDVHYSTPVDVKVATGVDIAWVEKPKAAASYEPFVATWEIKDGTNVEATFLRAEGGKVGSIPQTVDSPSQSGGPGTYNGTVSLAKGLWHFIAYAKVDGEEYQSSTFIFGSGGGLTN